MGQHNYPRHEDGPASQNHDDAGQDDRDFRSHGQDHGSRGGASRFGQEGRDWQHAGPRSHGRSLERDNVGARHGIGNLYDGGQENGRGAYGGGYGERGYQREEQGHFTQPANRGGHSQWQEGHHGSPENSRPREHGPSPYQGQQGRGGSDYLERGGQGGRGEWAEGPAWGGEGGRGGFRRVGYAQSGGGLPDHLRDQGYGHPGHYDNDNYAGWLGQAGIPADRPPHAGPRKGPKGYTRSDERLKEEICERLTARHDLEVSEVEVNVEGGKVTLDGSVPDRRSKFVIEDLVDNIWGVLELDNRLRVMRGGASNVVEGNQGSLGSTSGRTPGSVSGLVQGEAEGLLGPGAHSSASATGTVGAGKAGRDN